MTLLSVVKDVCATVGVLVPSSVFSNITGNRTAQEMLATANEMAQRIAYDTRDWTRLKTTVTYAGDGVVTAFNLPANYKRMLLAANVWRSTSQMAPMQFIPDLDTWLNRRSRDFYNSYGEWTMYGGQMHIAPVMSAFVAGIPEVPAVPGTPEVPEIPDDPGPPFVPGTPAIPAVPGIPAIPAVAAVPAVTATFAYLDKNCISLASGGFSDRFMADGDSFVLDERLLKLGMIWKWKAEKGSPYNEDLGTYEDALGYVAGHDSPAPIIVGRRTSSFAAQTAYPFPTPTEPVVPL